MYKLLALLAVLGLGLAYASWGEAENAAASGQGGDASHEGHVLQVSDEEMSMDEESPMGGDDQ